MSCYRYRLPCAVQFFINISSFADAQPPNPHVALKATEEVRAIVDRFEKTLREHKEQYLVAQSELEQNHAAEVANYQLQLAKVLSEC